MSEDARGRMAESPPHRQKTVLIPVDVDEPVVGLVVYLNSIPGVRTQTSCQGGKTYRPQVMITWTDDAMERLATEFDVTPLGDHWSYVHPRKELSAYDRFAIDPLRTVQAENARLRAVVDAARNSLVEVIAYNDGKPPYNFSRLPVSERAMATWDAWQEIRQRIEAAIATLDAAEGKKTP